MAPSTRRRIVVVHSSDELYGADRIVLQVVAALREHVDADVEVWLPDDVEHARFPLCEQLTSAGHAWRHAEFPVIRRVYMRPIGLLRLARRAVRAWRSLKSDPPDMVFLSSSACLLVAPVARLAGVRHRALHIQERWSRRGGALLRQLARSTTIRLAISEFVAEASRITDPAPIVLANCVDDAMARVAPCDVRSAPTTPLEYVVASRWNRWKGYGTLLAAWDLAGCPGRLSVLGGAPLVGDGVDVGELVRTAVTRPETVEIVGEVPDVAPHVAAADVVILPSDEPEPFGLVLIEAFSLGKPVIASRGGGPLEIVDDDVTGWLFDIADPRALAEVLRRLTPGEVAAAGRRARDAYDDRFRPDRYRERIGSLIDEELSRRSIG